MDGFSKGHKSFVEFLDRELSEFGLTHEYLGHDDYKIHYYAHEIRRVTNVDMHFLFFNWTEEEITVLAKIIAEPDTILENSNSNNCDGRKCDRSKLIIRLIEKEIRPIINDLVVKFEEEFYPMKAEIIY